MSNEDRYLTQIYSTGEKPYQQTIDRLLNQPELLKVIKDPQERERARELLEGFLEGAEWGKRWVPQQFSGSGYREGEFRLRSRPNFAMSSKPSNAFVYNYESDTVLLNAHYLANYARDSLVSRRFYNLDSGTYEFTSMQYFQFLGMEFMLNRIISNRTMSVDAANSLEKSMLQNFFGDRYKKS